MYAEGLGVSSWVLGRSLDGPCGVFGGPYMSLDSSWGSSGDPWMSLGGFLWVLVCPWGLLDVLRGLWGGSGM